MTIYEYFHEEKNHNNTLLILVLNPLLNNLRNIITDKQEKNSKKTDTSTILSCHQCDDKSLSFYTATAEQWTLKQTGKSGNILYSYHYCSLINSRIKFIHE